MLRLLRVSLLHLVLITSSAIAYADEQRNLFGLPDVTDVESDEVHRFAAGLSFRILNEDPNAQPWPNEFSHENPMRFDGLWSSRWNSDGGDSWSGPANARIVKRGGRLFIRYFTGEDESAGGYLIEAVKQPDGLYIGRYSTAGAQTSSGFWVGRIVSHERIDGFWTTTGRWDFRRKFE